MDSNIEVFENDMQMYLSLFCEEQGIENMKHESQSVWNSALRYIYKHVFKGTNALKSSELCGNNSGIMDSTYNAYDYDLVLKVLDIYIFDMCMRYDKEVSIIGFSTLTGIDPQNIYNWAKDSTKLSQRSFDIYKRLRDFREESLSNKLVTGKQNPVGVLGVLNRHYQWNLPGVSRETSGHQRLGAADLPKLGQNISTTSNFPSICTTDTEGEKSIKPSESP